MYAIKTLREKAGLTQEGLSQIMKIDRSTVAKWETGEAAPRTDKLPELARILHCRIDDLFERGTG